MITEKDFMQYLINHKEAEDTDLFDRSTIEGQLQYEAYMEQIPTLNETTKVGTDLHKIDKMGKEIDILDYKGKLEEKELKAKALGLGTLNDDINSEIGDLATWFSGDHLAKSFKDASITKLTGLKTDKTEQLSVDEIDNIMNVLETNIFNQLEASEGETGFWPGDATANKMENIIERYFAGKNSGNKKNKLKHYII